MSNEMLPIKVDIGAKAEIKTEIPSQATGRLVNALTDALSPFSEGLGLIGDEIRAVRRDRAIKRLNAARFRMLAAGLTIGTVPDEFLLPWTEHTAQDGEDDLEIVWQNLLISASVGYARRMKSFPAILAELNGEDVRFLDSMCPPDIPYDERQIIYGINDNLKEIHGGFGEGSGTDVDYDRIKRALDVETIPYARAQTIEINALEKARYTPSQSYHSLPTTFGILVRNGLLEATEIQIKKGGVQGDVRYVRLTPLGDQFVRACRGPNLAP